MRIAFITPEFVTDYPDGGGLGTYLKRIGKLLVEQGHEAEVFVPSRLEPKTLVHDGIRVERVPPGGRGLWMRVLRRASLLADAEYPYSLFMQARALAAAMERRHREARFDIVQSADYLAVGLAVRRATGRIHVVRCSSAVGLYNEVDGRRSKADRWRERLQHAALRRADKVYAPSRFVADHYRSRHNIAVDVVRPPVGLEITPATDPPCGLPERFLVHFGQLCKRKGTGWLCESLKRAFVMEPSLRMVWIGRGDFTELGQMRSSLGQHGWKVQVLHPLPKPQLYAVVQRADASVLPSLVDNLPNTVIESLMLGIPVIGTAGASIDELVEHGVTGELVVPGDVEGLAGAMVRVWRRQSPVRKGYLWHGAIVDEMQPQRAVENLLCLAGRGDEGAYNSRSRVARSLSVTGPIL